MPALAGFGKELFTDAGKYAIHFGSTPTQAAEELATAIQVRGAGSRAALGASGLRKGFESVAGTGAARWSGCSDRPVMARFAWDVSTPAEGRGTARGPPDPHAPQKGADPPLFPPLPPSPTPPALSSVQAQHPDRPPPSVTALARVRTDVAVIPTSTGNQLVVQRPLALGQRMIALAAAISIDYGARRGAVPCRAAHRRTVRQACSACQPLAVEHLPACSWPSQ